jgi:2-polyprenyl-3-methyl-5-hydroxy-6-metoxy-1,4-benzoquinol methylase
MNNMTLTTIQNPRWGGQCRNQKAKAIEQTLRHYVDQPLEQLVCVDLGCGSGGIALHLASHVYFMTGVDMAP